MTITITITMTSTITVTITITTTSSITHMSNCRLGGPEVPCKKDLHTTTNDTYCYNDFIAPFKCYIKKYDKGSRMQV